MGIKRKTTLKEARAQKKSANQKGGPYHHSRTVKKSIIEGGQGGSGGEQKMTKVAYLTDRGLERGGLTVEEIRMHQT